MKRLYTQIISALSLMIMMTAAVSVRASLPEGNTATMVSITQTDACIGYTASLIHVGLQGNPPLRFMYTDGVQTYEVLTNEMDVDIPVEPVITTTYSLVSVIDGNGEAGTVSGEVTLNVHVAPSILQNLDTEPQYACTADAVTMYVDAEGWNLEYRWRRNGVMITDNATAVTATLFIPSFSSGDSGLYDCVINGSCSESPMMSAAHPLLPSVRPRIVSGPSSSSIQTCPGSHVSMSIMTEGSDVEYRWRRNGVEIPGAHAAFYDIATAGWDDVGVYDCMVNSRCYASPLLSSSVTVQLDAPVGISAQPAPQTVCTTTDVRFSVTAFGSQPTYQWLKDGVVISANNSATTSQLILNNVGPADIADYSVRIGSPCNDGVVVSELARLTVMAVPEVTSVTSDVSVCEHSHVRLVVTASGLDPLFQWWKDEVIIPGATSTVLDIVGAVAGDDGMYVMVLLDRCAEIVTEPIRVSVFAPIGILEQPRSTATCMNTPLILSVHVAGSVGMAEWRRDGVLVPHQQSTELRIERAEATDAGRYVCTIHGAPECTPQTLQSEAVDVVIITPPRIVAATTTAYAALNGEARMYVSTAGENALESAFHYQWYKDGMVMQDDDRVQGSNEAVLIVRSVQREDAQHVYACRVQGQCGEAWSNEMHLAIPPLSIVEEPSDAHVCAGNSSFVRVVAFSDEGVPLAYQWYRNGLAIDGATGSALTFASFTDADNGEYNVRMNLGDNVWVDSRTARLVAIHAPKFAVEDDYRNISLCPGTYFDVKVQLSQGNQLAYQWYLNGVLIEGATENEYVEYSLQKGAGGEYAVRVWNSCGVIERSIMGLTVLPRTVIDMQPPTRVIVREGTLLRFAVEASGEEVQYQWEHEGVIVEGATDAVFAKVASVSDAGSYKARIISRCGFLISDPVLVMVNAVSDVEATESGAWSIEKCQPNPMGDHGIISVIVPRPSTIRLAIVDLFGREVAMLRHEFVQAGMYDVVVDAVNERLASGAYTIVLSDESNVRRTMPMLIVR